MSLSRRSKAAEPGSSSDAPFPEKGAWASLPDLLAFMCQQHWEDGSSRQTGTMMLFTESGVWKCWLHDRDASQGCFLSSSTLEGVLKKANEIAGGAGGDWRPDRKEGRKGR